jgi:CheY-like chemotaxis protein
MTFSVQDTGIGIREEDMDKLFAVYSQVDSKSNRYIEGTGLGLALTRKMAEMMGGTVTVESEYGKGSLFTATICQKRVTDTPIGTDAADNLRKFQYTSNKYKKTANLVRVRLPYARILLVDDVHTNLEVAKGMMRPYGMQIDCVTGGADAVEAIRREKARYSAVFMDHMMPGMDGVEATRIIREEIGTEYAKNVPIIMLTANAIAGNEEMFLSKGFQAFLSKPIDIMRLDSVIRQWVRDKSKEDIPDGQEDPGVQGIQDTVNSESMFAGWQVSGLDLPGALEKFGDEETLQRILRVFVDETPALLEQMGRVDKEKLHDYAIIAHGLKGNCRGICAEQLGDQAEKLEHAAKAGEFDDIEAYNASFIRDTVAMLAQLRPLLKAEEEAKKAKKARKSAPDPALLKELLEAGRDFDIDRVDNAISELRRYEYDEEGDLVLWLEKTAGAMDFKQIAKRLSQIL